MEDVSEQTQFAQSVSDMNQFLDSSAKETVRSLRLHSRISDTDTLATRGGFSLILFQLVTRVYNLLCLSFTATRPTSNTVDSSIPISPLSTVGSPSGETKHASLPLQGSPIAPLSRMSSPDGVGTDTGLWVRGKLRI